MKVVAAAGVPATAAAVGFACPKLVDPQSGRSANPIDPSLALNLVVRQSGDSASTEQPEHGPEARHADDKSE